jgi:hypothetical protein
VRPARFTHLLHAALSFICVSKQSENDRLRPTGAVYYDYRQRKIGKLETEGDAQYSLSELLESLKQARGDLDSCWPNVTHC